MLAAATNPVHITLLALAAYAAIGFLFSLAYLTRGAPSIDPAIKASPARVRLLFLPGTVALWPLLAIMWITSRSTDA